MSPQPDQSSPPRTSPATLSPLRLVAAVSIVAPFVAILWIPSYDRIDPRLFGFPFFYWYQLLWVVITAALMVVAFQAVKRDNAVRYPSADGGPTGDASTDSVADGGSTGDGGEAAR